MRVVPISCLKSGMRLAKHIYGSSGELYLKAHTALTLGYIQRLKSLGFNGIYIEDDISDGIANFEVVDDKLRIKTVEKVKSLYGTVAADARGQKEQISSLDSLINDILDEMLEKNALAYNILDLKQFDDYTFYHCVNTTFLAIATAIQLKLSRAKIHDLSMGAIMHDIGKVYIPIEIINKPDALTDLEFEQMKTHSLHGYRYLKETGRMPDEVCRGVLLHHERHDGKGYPYGLEGKKINPIGKIISICDVYDAITSDRPYRSAWRPHEAIEYVMGNSGIRFDPDITAAFLKKIMPYPVGSIVQLSNKMTGIIIENDINFALRPKVRVFMEGENKVEPYLVDLNSSRDYLGVTVTGTINI